MAAITHMLFRSKYITVTGVENSDKKIYAAQINE